MGEKDCVEFEVPVAQEMRNAAMVNKHRIEESLVMTAPPTGDGSHFILIIQLLDRITKPESMVAVGIAFP